MNDLEKAAQIVLDAYKNGHDLVKPMVALSTALHRLEQIRPRTACKDADLYDADPDCQGSVVPASGGGVRCDCCSGWFCF